MLFLRMILKLSQRRSLRNMREFSSKKRSLLGRSRESLRRFLSICDRRMRGRMGSRIIRTFQDCKVRRDYETEESI